MVPDSCPLLRHLVPSGQVAADFIHKLRIAMKELKESRAWLLFASRIKPCEQVAALRDEARQLVLMLGKSVNTAVARSRGSQI